MTEAVLGFKIDSTPASSAAVDLDKLTAAATRTGQAVDKLEAEAAGLGTVLKKAGDDARSALPPVENLGRSFGSQDDHVRAFRMEVERLTLKFRPLAQATQQYEATVTDIQRAHKLGAITAQEMTAALDRERQAYERLKTAATAAGSAVKAANSNRGGAQSFNSANATAQFQDIAVTAAMGMNPLMIGLQQGTQLASVVGSMERPVSGLAAAFTSLLSPVSLVTIGLTAGTAALIQYFTTAESGAESTSKLFEEQNDIIRQAATLWGDAAPQLKAYVDELDRADKITQGRQAAEILAGRELEGLSENLDSIKQQGAEAFRALRGDPNNAIIIRDLREAWGDLRDRLDDGTASMADLNRVQRELSNAVAQYGVPEVQKFSDAFDKVTEAIYRGVEAAQKARTAWIAALAGGANVQDILSGATFTEDGRTFRSADFVPFSAPTPGRRPNIELSGDPDDVSIINSDGRRVGVPIPGQKPNQFELEKEADAVDDVTKAYRRAQDAKADFWLDLSFQERQAGRSAMDQQIATTLTRYGFNEDLQSPEASALRQQMRSDEAKGLFKDFFSGAYQEAWANGGKIGDALGKAALNAAQKATEKAWEAVFDKLASAASSWLLGGTSLGSGSFATSGVSGVTTTLGALLGVGGASAANDNRSAGIASNIPTTDIASYIATAAQKRGIDPNVALAVAKSEGGLKSWNLQSNYVKNGVREPSFGPFQLYKGGGLGNEFMARTGLDPALAANGPAGVDFALDHAAKNGWGAWYGAKNSGIGNFEGIGKTSKAIEDLGSAATATAQMTTGLGQTLASIPQALMANGGGSGLLSGLTKYGMGLFSGSAQFAGAWASGGIGLYANGTDYAPGGLSIVGERGPELLNLPQGSGVMNNHKLMEALNDNRSGGGGGIAGIRLFVDQDGNWQAKVESIARGTASEVSGSRLAQYSDQQRRGGFGTTQRRYNSQKG